jgi:hypothetical protein
VNTRVASKDERQLALLWLAAATSALALRPLWLAIAPHFPPCVFRALTGIPCPTCGTTRAATALLDGRLVEALAANPLATAAGLTFIVGAPFAALWAILGWPVPVFPPKASRWLRLGILILIVTNWLYLVIGG